MPVLRHNIVERVAHYMHKARVRQYFQDQCNVQEVLWRLVEKDSCPFTTVRLNHLQILLAIGLASILRQRG